MVCNSCRITISRNFVSSAVLGESIAQGNFWSDLMEWWNSLEPMYQYAIIGGAGLSIVIILFLLFRPTSKAGVKGLEELLRLKMLKELAQ